MDTKELMKRIDLSLIYPRFLSKYEQLLVNCYKRGALYYAISGTRTVKEQAELYAQGRTKPGKIVTNARPGTSAHNYGIAVDSCRDAEIQRAGLQPDWDMEDYKILAEEAKKLDLESAYFWTTFQEGPHVQLPLYKHGIKFDDLKKIEASGGLKEVWKYLDQFKS